MPRFRTRREPVCRFPAFPTATRRNVPSRFAFAALVLLLCLVFPSRVSAQIFSAEVKKVSENFVCQCSCNHQLSGCGMLHCGSANPLRSEIDEKLQAGMTETQIVDDFVAKYGKLILSAPTAEGFDLVAWTLPVIALLAGLIVVYGVIFKWTRRKPVLAQGQGGAAIPEEYQNRLERELKDLD